MGEVFVRCFGASMLNDHLVPDFSWIRMRREELPIILAEIHSENLVRYIG